jgi:hypothetical protein
MPNMGSSFLSVIVCLVSIVCFFHSNTFAQVEKGTKEVLVFSSDFSINVNEPAIPDSNATGSVFGFENTRTFNIGGKFGYFLSQRNEVGAGTNFSVARFKFCARDFINGQLISKECDSDTRYDQGLSDFYRYNFADKGDKRFLFAGTELSVSSVRRNFTGNFKLRPQVGYKYFLNKNVALDLSVGCLVDLNKKNDSFVLLQFGRQVNIDGQLGLSFIF